MRLRTANNHKRRAEHNRRSREWRDKLWGHQKIHTIPDGAVFTAGGRMMGKTLEMTHVAMIDGPDLEFTSDEFGYREVRQPDRPIISEYADVTAVGDRFVRRVRIK